MTPSPLVRSELTAECFRAALEHMCAGPGWNRGADLYRGYVEMCQKAGLTPLSAKSFGAGLKKLGHRPAIRRISGKHARCWRINRTAFSAAGS